MYFCCGYVLSTAGPPRGAFWAIFRVTQFPKIILDLGRSSVFKFGAYVGCVWAHDYICLCICTFDPMSVIKT